MAGLKRQDARELAGELRSALPKITKEQASFGGDLMDPRIGTSRPGSPAVAVRKLLAEWEVGR